LVQVYKDGVGSYSPTVECTEDLTAPDNQTWKTNLTNWIPTQFGDNYLVQVYVAASGIINPQTAGTKLFAAGSGNDDTWFFDYQAGLLNFNGTNIPSQITGGVTGKSIYIVGYRYVGPFGVGGSTPTQIVNGTSNVNVVSSGGNVTVGIAGTGNVAVFTTTGVSLTGNVTANYFVGNGSAITSVMADRGGDQNNWDTLFQMGVYTVNRVSWSGTVGTPTDSQDYVGLLQVMNSTSTAITQVFLPGTVESGNVKIQWNRSYWSGTWTSWYKIVNDYQVVSGGEF
jgi:hypothetical protein